MAVIQLAASIGVLAGIWTYLSATFGIATWPAFVGWALFFAAGGDAKAMPKAALPAITGTLLGWVAVQAIPFLGGGTVGLTVAVTLAAFVMVALALVPGFGFVPAQFASAAAFFGMGATTAAIGTNLLPLILGILFGFVSGWLPSLLPAKKAAAVEEKAS